jgi:alkylated DNA repair protein (DNA oxidative demethylase)
VQHYPQKLDRAAQEALLAALREIIAEAPLFTPAMPRSGTPMSVRMTNCGPLGWVTDKERGYRYQAAHPVTGKPWPAMPLMLLDLWDEVADYPHPPEACLVNYYTGAAKMGLHQDRDEVDFAAPVLSVSLGDIGVFRVGGSKRKEPTQKFELCSGDVFVLVGAGRLA